MNHLLNYIDVRGPWPIYFCGGRAYVLAGVYDRGISVEAARILLGLDREEVRS